jgi:hypothetical protein
MSVSDWLINAGLSLIPPTLVGVVFYVVMRAILRADSTERKAYAEMEAKIRAEREGQPAAKAPTKGKTKKDA